MQKNHTKNLKKRDLASNLDRLVTQTKLNQKQIWLSNPENVQAIKGENQQPRHKQKQAKDDTVKRSRACQEQHVPQQAATCSRQRTFTQQATKRTKRQPKNKKAILEKQLHQYHLLLVATFFAALQLPDFFSWPHLECCCSCRGYLFLASS